MERTLYSDSPFSSSFRMYFMDDPPDRRRNLTDLNESEQKVGSRSIILEQTKNKILVLDVQSSSVRVLTVLQSTMVQRGRRTEESKTE